MMRIFTVFILFLLLSSNTFSTNEIKADAAHQKVPGAVVLWYDDGNDIPSFVKFADDFILKEVDVAYWMKAQFDLNSQMSFVKLRTIEGAKGISHTTYAMHFGDAPIEFMRINVHHIDGLVKSISSNITSHSGLANRNVLSPSESFNIALESVGAELYKWQHSEEEAWKKEQNSSFKPKAKLVVVEVEDNSGQKELRYAHLYDVYAHKPLSRSAIYIDAENGEVLRSLDLLKKADSLGKANTAYSGLNQITTSFISGEFRLVENKRGGGIHTWNFNNTTEFSNATDFTNDKNDWFMNPTPGDLDRFATDAHWGAEMIHDYYLNKFGRKSYDNANAKLNMFVHYGEGFDGVLFDGENVLIGDGYGLPHATLDVLGHELTHGVIDHSAGLIGSDESGALAESYADIFGNCIEKFANSNDNGWKIGEDRLGGVFIRDMADPNEHSHPDTYKGRYWYEGTDDNGGVHTNCSVHNYWFYLLTEGGSGKNDQGDVYSIDGIGVNDAALIAYETMTGYLTPNSDFEDARYYSIQVAIDLFGNCSPQHTAVANAWYAVGLGDFFRNETVASFDLEPMSYCHVPFTINFNNNSINGNEYLWEFGDGTTSNEANPSHTYTELGSYAVKLTTKGLDHCGESSFREDDLFTVSQPVAPHSQDPPGDRVIADLGEQVLLKATTPSDKGEVYWYARHDDKLEDYIAIGETYIIPIAEEADTFYIRTIVPGNKYDVGASLDAAQDGEFSSAGYSMKFDMLQTGVIESIMVSSAEETSKTLIVKNESGNQIYNKVFELVQGKNQLVLNLELDKADNYEMYISGTEKNFWRGNDAEFPYEIPGIISLRGSDLNPNVYPYFYDWVVSEQACNSQTAKITVGISNDRNGDDEVPYQFYYESRSNGSMSYHLALNFTQETSVTYGLYSISGQMLLTHTTEKKVKHEENLTQVLDLDNLAGGVYFITIQGGILEKSERVIIKTGSN